MDGDKGNKAFAKSIDADYPILSDASKEVAKAYGVVHGQRQVPERWTFYIGKDGKILYVDKAVKHASHGADIAAKLKELGLPEK
jgi:thioredoxin-dependent peroxiredoxin